MIEKYLPYAASYTAAMSAANATPSKIFRSLAMNKEIYGDVADDAAMVYRDVTLLGYDLITAMKMSVDRAASVWLTEFFQGMVGTLDCWWSTASLYFLNRAEHYMRENRTRLQMFLGIDRFAGRILHCGCSRYAPVSSSSCSSLCSGSRVQARR